MEAAARFMTCSKYTRLELRKYLECIRLTSALILLLFDQSKVSNGSNQQRQIAFNLASISGFWPSVAFNVSPQVASPLLTLAPENMDKPLETPKSPY